MSTRRKTAPAVRYPVQAPKMLDVGGLLVCCVMALPLLAWQWVQGMPAGVWPWVIVCLWLVFTANTLWQIRRWFQGTLHWDGQAWWLQPRDQAPLPLACAPLVVLDAQGVVGLRCFLRSNASAGRRWFSNTVWIWVWRRSAPGRWLDLRRALYQPRTLLAEAQFAAPTTQSAPGLDADPAHFSSGR